MDGRRTHRRSWSKVSSGWKHAPISDPLRTATGHTHPSLGAADEDEKDEDDEADAASLLRSASLLPLLQLLAASCTRSLSFHVTSLSLPCLVAASSVPTNGLGCASCASCASTWQRRETQPTHTQDDNKA